MGRKTLLTTAALALTMGCAPVDAAGGYTVAVTNGPNACNFDNWTEGDSTTGIPMTITQDGAEAEIVVEGLAGGLLTALTGTNRFESTVSGDTVSGRIIGVNSAREGNCTFTVDVDVVGTLTGDSLQGELSYSPNTNNHPDCGVLDACSNTQPFSGSRPPR